MKKHLGTVSIFLALLGYVVVIVGLLSSDERIDLRHHHHSVLDPTNPYRG